jgi:hypothetical protein
MQNTLVDLGQLPPTHKTIPKIKETNEMKQKCVMFSDSVLKTYNLNVTSDTDHKCVAYVSGNIRIQ